MTEAENTSTEKKPTAKKPSAPRKPAVKKEPVEERKPAPRKRTFAPDDFVTVRNGYQGKLVYKSSKTGEKYVFDCFGDEHDMEIQELKKAKNDSKKFFANNWFLIDDPEVIDYLGLREYYKDALTYEEFDKLAEMNADENAERISKVSEGQKISVAHHAKRMISDGKIDSLSAISALEKGLGVQLLEH